MADDPRFDYAENEVELQRGWSVVASGFSFTFFHKSEIRAMSVVSVDNPTHLTTIGEPTPGGLHDRRMGPMSDTASGGSYLEDCCLTCGLNFYYCPGHFGRIELPFPVINPLCYESVGKLLRVCCVGCKRLKLSDESVAKLAAEYRAAEAGFVAESDDVAEEVVEEDLRESPSEVFPTASLLERKKKIHAQFVKQAASQKCPHCGIISPKFMTVSGRFLSNKTRPAAQGRKQKEKSHDIGDFEKAGEDAATGKLLDLLSRELFTPSIILAMLRQVWLSDGKSLGRLFPFLRELDRKVWEHPTDALFIEVLAVPPPKVRPMSFANGTSSAHATTEALKSVVVAVQNVFKVSEALKSRENTGSGPLEAAFFELQHAVNRVYDRDFPGLRRLPGDKLGTTVGLKQMLEKKDGLFRMYMMGKRVDFAARSVITPDPLIGVEEIGIPFNFATKLTFPTPVTAWNVDHLRAAVINGPDVYPGAEMIEMEDGRRIMLRNCKLDERKALAAELTVKSNSYRKARANKVVHRHMTSGDMVLVNRQPSLHRASIMAHKVRVLTKTRNTLRLHYANCKAYNADFDGDEMNVHFPQNYLARSEAQFISNVGNQYLVPKDGTPLSGLIQDHVIAGVRLTIRGKFLTREEYCQLLYAALGRQMRGRPIRTVPPAILYPKELWSGKQVITTMLLNLTPANAAPLTMESKAKLKEDSFRVAPLGPRYDPSAKNLGESLVVIRGGHLLQGVLDKNQLGSTSYSVVHAFYELYGSDYSCALLSSLSSLLTCFLSWHAFSLGVHDVLVNPGANAERSKILRSASKIGYTVMKDVLEFKEEVDSRKGRAKIRAAFRTKYFSQERNVLLQRMDMSYKRNLDSYVNDVQSTCMARGGLMKSFPDNNLLFMVDTGAKGSKVNALQMSCMLGQMELEGRRPGLMISGKTLPSFDYFDPAPRAGGFIAGRYMTGIGPQELFFHCMAGREGLVDTAVKTSRSGYLQRSLVKHLESIRVGYDSTVRDADETIIQFMYGEDGMEVGKTPYLSDASTVDIFNKNRMGKGDAAKMKTLQDVYTDVDGVETRHADVKHYESWRKKKKLLPMRKSNARRIAESPFCHFYANWCAEQAEGGKKARKSGPGRKQKAVSAWHFLDDFSRARYLKKACNGGAPDPVVADYPPGCHFGAVTERLDALIEAYVDKGSLPPGEAATFRDRMRLKAITSQVQPGEAVGIVAAQSIGEPSTQMTLNTFHFAGRGEVNVTLGIPRLREILMTASDKIKTPTMEVPSKLTDAVRREVSLGRLKAHFCRVTLSDALEKLVITEELDVSSAIERWVYRIRVFFMPERYFRDIKSATILDAIDHLEKRFFKQVLSEVRKKAGIKKNLLETSKKKKFRDSVYDEEDAGPHSVGGVDDFDEDGGGGRWTRGKTPRRAGLLGDEDEDVDEWDEGVVGGDDGERDATEARLAARDDDERDDFEADPDDEVEPEDCSYVDGDVELNAMNGSVDCGGAAEEEEEEVLGGNRRRNAFTSLSWKAARKTVRRELDVRRIRVKSFHASVVDYTIDVDDLQWCQFDFALDVGLKRVDVAEVCWAVAEKSVLHQVRDITKAVVVTGPDGEPWLRTEGINFAGLYDFGEELDLNRILCNSIHDMARIYGIEAAARTIVMELENVFKVYGIVVDRRHLTLVADYMTVGGSIRGYNRRGLDNSPSPLQKITFETATGFLKAALINAEYDTLSSVSASLVVGKDSKIGTGAFSTIYSLTLQDKLLADF